MRIKFEIFQPAEPVQTRVINWPAPLPVPMAGDEVMLAEQENLIVAINKRIIVLEPDLDYQVILVATATR